jgi:hypothetical protein
MDKCKQVAGRIILKERDHLGIPRLKWENGVKRDLDISGLKTWAGMNCREQVEKVASKKQEAFLTA